MKIINNSIKIPENYTGIVEYPDGTNEHYLNGKLHREDGPACEYSDGIKSWYLNGKRHRKNGPAVEFLKGSNHWYLNGKLHREDGPAVEWIGGANSYYYNGIELNEDRINFFIKYLGFSIKIAVRLVYYERTKKL